MVPKWAQNNPKIVPKWSQNSPKIVPKWSQNSPKIVPKWSQKGSRRVSKMVPKLYEYRTRQTVHIKYVHDIKSSESYIV